MKALLLVVLVGCDTSTVDTGPASIAHVDELRWSCDGTDIEAEVPELAGALFSVHQWRSIGAEQVDDLTALGGWWKFYPESGLFTARCGVDSGEVVLRYLSL